METLQKNGAFSGPEGPVVLVVMDGVGIGKHPDSDYVRIADTPNLDWLREHALYFLAWGHLEADAIDGRLAVGVALVEVRDANRRRLGAHARRGWRRWGARARGAPPRALQAPLSR